jgi:hypothetical protein
MPEKFDRLVGLASTPINIADTFLDRVMLTHDAVSRQNEVIHLWGADYSLNILLTLTLPSL